MKPAWFRQAGFLLVEINHAKSAQTAESSEAQVPYAHSSWLLSLGTTQHTNHYDQLEKKNTAAAVAILHIRLLKTMQ